MAVTRHYHVYVNSVNLKPATYKDGTVRRDHEGNEILFRNSHILTENIYTKDAALAIAKEAFRIGCVLPKCESVVASVTEYVKTEGTLLGIDCSIARKVKVHWQDLYDPTNAPSESTLEGCKPDFTKPKQIHETAPAKIIHTPEPSKEKEVEPKPEPEQVKAEPLFTPNLI